MLPTASTAPTVAATGDGGPSRVAVTGVAKAFGATQALRDAALDIHPAEVHTVIGENGSGKSTLVKVLSGVHRPDQGELVIDGQPTGWHSTPQQAHRVGVATVFQEVLTVPGRTVLENVWLGAPRAGADQAQRRARAEQLLGDLIGRPVDVTAPIDSLSLSDRQACCIVRALVRDPALLILDESTASLDVATRDRLFELVRERTAGGTSVLFISHRMDEVFAISDVVTVFRNGVTVASRIPIDQTSVRDLVELMSDVGERPERRGRGELGPVVIRADGVRLTADAEPINLEIRSGELVGLAGLEGQGQDLFIKALNGQGAAGGTVLRASDGEEVAITSPADARRNGIAYVPRERRREGLFDQLTIRENFGLPRLGEDTVGPIVSYARTEARLASVAERLNIKMAKPSHAVASLSGGNQQKVLVARSLAESPAMLLLNDPTRGIDPNAKHDLYDVLLDLCERGLAVVMVSSEVDELVDLADRVVVFRGSRVNAHLVDDAVTRTAIVAAYFDGDGHSEASPTNGGIQE